MKIGISLKTALIINYILVSALPLLIIGLVALHFERRDLLRVTSGETKLLADTVAAEVDMFLQEPLQTLRHVGAVTQVPGFVQGSAIDEFLDSVVATDSFIENIFLVDEKAQVRHAGLSSSKKVNRGKFLGLDFSNEEFYRQARQEPRHSWNRGIVALAEGESGLILTLPLQRGMIIAQVDPMAVNRMIAPISSRKGIYAYIANGEGTVLAHPDKAMIRQKLRSDHLDMITEELAGRLGAYRYADQGKEILGSASLVKETGWMVVVDRNLENALLPVARMEKIFVAGLLFSLFIALVNMYWSLERLLRPFQRLIDSTQMIAAGNYDVSGQRITIHEADELAMHLQAMAAAVKSREEVLRQQNEDLSMAEEELRQQVDEYLKSQDDLLEANHALGALFAAAPLAIVSFDTAGIVRMWNPAAERIFGWSRTEVTGAANPLLEGQDKPFQALLERSMIGETVSGIELQRMKKSRLPIDISLDLAPLYNAKGEIAGVMALMADISQRKQAEKALIESDTRFTLFMDNLPARAYMKDVNGHYLYANKTLRKYLEEKGVPWAGRRDDDIWPFSTAALFKEHDLFVLERKTAVQVVEPVEEGDGISYWLDSKFPILNENGECILIAGVTIDITERKQAEEALQAERARLFALLQGLPAYVYLKGPDHKFHFVNDFFRRNFGDPEGKKCYEIFQGRHGSCADCLPLRTMQTRSNCKWEWTTDSGRTFEVYDYPFTDIDGSPLTLELGMDITERITAEERTKTSLKEKEVLLKEIHHRVKNNLQVVSSLLNLQSRYIHDQRDVEMFMDSQNRVKSMALIHENLYKTQNLARIDFAGYIQKLSANLFRSFGVSAGAVTLNTDIADVSLDIDTAVPCGLIINELMSNSLKHGFPNGRSGRIDVELSIDSGNFILVVRDDGIGLPPGLDFRSTESLGLQLVNTLSQQIGGDIILNGESCTEFRITFREQSYRERV